MSVNDRIKKLEQRPQPQHSHGMTQETLAILMGGLRPRERDAFLKTMTDDDLTAGIEYLKTINEHHNAST